MAKVSIITASYNYENYIVETIQSVLNQTFKDWELIVVDDGSSDNSVNVIKDFCLKDERIKFFQHENGVNKGLCETIKLGISKATTDWIVFLESDDTITPDYLEKKFNIIEKFPEVDFIYNDVNMFGDKTLIDEYNIGYFDIVRPILNNLSYPTEMLDLFQKLKNNNLISTFSVVMIKKSLFENIDFNSPIKPYLDWYLWLQIISKTNCKFYYLPDKLTNWRMHKASYISAKLKHKEKFLFDIKKNELLYLRFSKLHLFLFNFIRILRKASIKIHLKKGEIFIFGRVFKFLPTK